MANGYVSGGKQLQHIVYSIAAETILKNAGESSPKVIVSGYIFPTEKGEGKCFPRSTSRMAEGLKTIEDLFDRMAAGMFVGTGDDCKYCDYKSICPADREQRWKELKLLGDAEVVEMGKIRDQK
jgi:ATP-dependent helicase/nuclease subunit B